MDFKELVINEIRRQELRVSKLKHELDTAQIYLKAQRDMLKLMGEDALSSVGDSGADDSSLRSGGDPAKVRDILKEAGKPLHVMELLGRLGKPQTPENRATLTGTLSNYVRKGRVFAKTAPNTFGLITSAVEFADDNVPENFGAPEADKPVQAPSAKVLSPGAIDLDESIPF